MSSFTNLKVHCTSLLFKSIFEINYYQSFINNKTLYESYLKNYEGYRHEYNHESYYYDQI